jgi:hypothetical protein
MIGVDLIIKSLLQKPENWTQKEYVLEHKNGLSIWTKNGKTFLGIRDPEDIPFTSLERKRVYQAIKKWQRLKILYLARKLDVD